MKSNEKCFLQVEIFIMHSMSSLLYAVGLKFGAMLHKVFNDASFIY